MFAVADEALFRQVLALERRRCERTDTRLALVLVDFGKLSRTLTNQFVDQTAVGIRVAVRETDITGWYRHASIIGVILTTLNGTGRATLEPVMRERIRGVLSHRLDPLQIQNVAISCHIFPDDDVSNRIFYSEHTTADFKSETSAFIKRAIDVAGSFTALVALSPLLAAIAILIKATSPGPVLFKQKRIGQFGEEFTFLKFRSMYVNNDPTIHKEYIQNLIEKKVSDSGGTYKIKNDPRVTRIGRFLRKSSFDELPQFINVLMGEMSLVGPRPPITYELERYSLWHLRRVLEAKPGITGEWQVNGRSRTTFDEMVRMDIHYARNRSVWLDLKILLKTPLAVISGSGAY